VADGPSVTCSYLNKSAIVTPGGEVWPCCRFDARAQGINLKWNPTEQQFGEFFESGPLNRLRESARRGDRLPGCHKCYSEEALGLKSMRQKPLPFDRSTANAASADTVELQVLEIGVGRLCNLKCRTCSSYNSSKWDSDSAALGLDIPKSLSTPDLNEIDMSALGHVCSLKVTGGEPLINRSLFSLLEKLESHGSAHQIELEMFTNGTAGPDDRTLSALLPFKTSRISLSVDAVGERNTYIRHPSQWSIIDANAKRWLQLSRKDWDFSVAFAVTVSVFNVLYIFELLEWIYGLPKEKPSPVFFQFVHQPFELQVAGLPREIRELLATKFSEQRRRFSEKFQTKSVSAGLDQIEKMLGSARADSNLQLFLQRTRELDALRVERFEATFPELAEILLTPARVEARTTQ
jgi:MoaA/NifB/PqqE/SkfB family radical SAM enzyme